MFLLELEYRYDPGLPEELSAAEQIDWLRGAFKEMGFTIRKITHIPPDPFAVDACEEVKDD